MFHLQIFSFKRLCKYVFNKSVFPFDVEKNDADLTVSVPGLTYLLCLNVYILKQAW